MENKKIERLREICLLVGILLIFMTVLSLEPIFNIMESQDRNSISSHNSEFADTSSDYRRYISTSNNYLTERDSSSEYIGKTNE